jgi:Rrf2 family protein
MLTKKAKYALKALTQLAHSTGQPRTTAELAEREAIPKKFLEAILRELVQHAFVRSRKGPGGGYELARAADTISIASVLRVTDGPIAPVACLSQTAYQRCAECKHESTCGIRLVLRDAHEATMRILESTTVADLARRAGETDPSSRVLRYAI